MEQLLYNGPNPLLSPHDGCQLSSVPDQQQYVCTRDARAGKRPVRRREPNGTAEIPHRSPRKRQKRSAVWNYFQETDSDPNVAICLVCTDIIPRGRNLARNTTNLRKHLEHRHQDVYKSEYFKSYPAKREQSSPLLQSVNPLVESSEQFPNTNPHLNFPLMQPGPEPPQLSTEQINHAAHGTQQPPVHERSVLAAANAFHGSPHAGGNGRIPHRLVEEPTPDLSGEQERGFGASNLNFADHGLAMPQPRHKKVAADDKRRSYEPTENDGRHRFPGLRKSGVNNAARRNRNDIDAQAHLLPSEAVLPMRQGIGNSLVDYLAIMELPLMASKSKGFSALFAGTSVNVSFPSISRMRTSILPAQIEVLRGKIKDLLSNAEKVVIVVEPTETNMTLICRYLENGFKVRHVCLDVIPKSLIAEEQNLDQTLPISENYPVSIPNGDKLMHQRNDRRKLIEHVDQTVDEWNLWDKLIAIVIPGRCVEPSKASFRLRHGHDRGQQNGYCREDSGSSSNSRQHRGYTDIGRGPGPPLPDGSYDVHCILSHEGIPVIQCLVNTLEVIASTVICENKTVEQCIIEPMSRGMFKALGDPNYLQVENTKSRPSDLVLPLVNLSLETMLDVLEYFSEHLERVQDVFRRQGSETDLDILCLHKEDLELLKEILVPFAHAIQFVQEKTGKKSTFQSRQVSFAIPTMKQLAGKLEQLYRNATGTLKEVIKDAFQAVSSQYQSMQIHEVYSCATLLDPNFKNSQFSDAEMSRAARDRVTSACEAERRRYEGVRRVKASMRNNQDLTTGPSNTFDHFMDSIMGDHNMPMSCVTAYVQEPVTDYGEAIQNVEDHWRSRQQKWPILTKVALQYALIPCTCRTDREDAALGDYKQKLDVDGSLDAHAHGSSDVHVADVHTADAHASDAHALAFLRNNLLLVDGLSILSSR